MRGRLAQLPSSDVEAELIDYANVREAPPSGEESYVFSSVKELMSFIREKWEMGPFDFHR